MNGEKFPAKPNDLKLDNRRAILGLLKVKGQLSVTQLSKLSGLSRTTVMKVLNYFCSLGYVYSVGKGHSTAEGGKKPEVYAYNAKRGYVCALVIFEDSIRCAIADLNADIIVSMRIVLNANEELRQVVDNAAVLIMAVVDKAGVSLGELMGITIGVDALMDANSSAIIRAEHFPAWGRDVPLGELVQVALGKKIAVNVESTFRLLGYAESFKRPDLERKTVVTLFSSYDDVGACVMVRGQALKGHRGMAGEIRHMVIDPYGKKCACGGQGCLQTIITEKALLEDAKEAPPASELFARVRRGGLKAREVFASADGGDQFARQLMSKVAVCVAQAVTNIAFVCDPDEVVIQGVLARGGKYFYKELGWAMSRFQRQFSGVTRVSPAVIDLSRAYLLGPAVRAIALLMDERQPD